MSARQLYQDQLLATAVGLGLTDLVDAAWELRAPSGRKPVPWVSTTAAIFQDHVPEGTPSVDLPNGITMFGDLAMIIRSSAENGLSTTRYLINPSA